MRSGALPEGVIEAQRAKMIQLRRMLEVEG